MIQKRYHYRFNDNALDSSGNNTHGVILGGAFYSDDVPGDWLIKSLEFPGSGRFNALQGGFNPNGFTVSFWMKPLIYGLELGADEAWEAFFFGVYQGGDNVYCGVDRADDERFIPADFDVPVILLGEWHKYTFTIEKGTWGVPDALATFYRDDTVLAQKMMKNVNEDWDGIIIRNVNGNIADIRVYDFALTPEQVRALPFEAYSTGIYSGKVDPDKFIGDPQITMTPDGADIDFVDGQPKMDKGLANKALISLFTRNGWWGKSLGGNIGSDFEAQAHGPITLRTLETTRKEAERALKFPSFGDVRAEVKNISGQRLDMSVTISPPSGTPMALALSKYGSLWEQQSKKEE